MNESESLLKAMQGAKFDEFCIRKASMSLKFSQGDGVNSPVFILETTSNVSCTMNKTAEYEEATPESATFLYPLLETKLTELRKIGNRLYLAEFEGEARFYIADFDNLWDNVFSVRAVNWPGTGCHGSYFLI